MATAEPEPWAWRPPGSRRLIRRLATEPITRSATPETTRE
jgi:hypothetical protein